MPKIRRKKGNLFQKRKAQTGIRSRNKKGKLERQSNVVSYLSFIGRFMFMAQGETIGGKQNYNAEQYQTDEYIRRWVRFSRRGERYQIRHKISDARRFIRQTPYNTESR